MTAKRISTTPSQPPMTGGHGPLRLDDYPEATRRWLEERLVPLDALVTSLPRVFGVFTSLAASQGRGFLRALAARRDWQDVTLYCAMLLEPYEVLRHPNFHIVSPYYSPVERLLADKMGKTVSHIPRQFGQIVETFGHVSPLNYVVHACSLPDADGFVSLGVNCDLVPSLLEEASRHEDRKIVFEVNRHVPWVNGHPSHGENRFHISRADYLYEHHEPLPQVPGIKPTPVEERIAEIVLGYVEDGDTLQLGIGGLPGSIASRLKQKRNLRIHSEMLSDWLVDLMEAGAVTTEGKAYLDGYVVGTFAAGTQRLYDFLHRNPKVILLPIEQVNDPYAIGQNHRMKSINSTLMVDLHGQFCSDAVGKRQVSGIGGQLEFVIGAQRSEGGRSLMCLKSTRVVGGKPQSAIVWSLPPGSPICVPRQLADVVVTEYGAAELRYLNAQERAHALVGIAHPDFRGELIAQAKKLGLWDLNPGFASPVQRVLYDNIGSVRRLQQSLKRDPKGFPRAVLHEVAGHPHAKRLAERVRGVLSRGRRPGAT